jgi:hypothetical protein
MAAVVRSAGAMDCWVLRTLWWVFVVASVTLVGVVSDDSSGTRPDAHHSHTHSQYKPQLAANAKKYPLCGHGLDTHGMWFKVRHDNNSDAFNITEDGSQVPLDLDIDAHFLEPNNHGEALFFDDLWVPKHCSYMRFTNKTLEQCVNHEIQKGAHSTLSGKDEKRVHLVFMGDSGLRGYVCGIGRILSGSEVYGPNINHVCGGPNNQMAVSTSKLGIPITNEYFGGRLLITFIYVKGFHIKNMDWHLEFFTYNTKPYAIILSTGAWDFDHIARARGNGSVITSEECTTEEEFKVSRERSDDFVNRTMWEIGLAGQKLGIKMIYRNNHHQARFGTVCADKQFEAMIDGSPWQIFDSRRVSKNIWKSQTYDGFHFDRHRIDTVEMHEYIYEVYKGKNYTRPGALEMQFSQSLLNFVFYDCIHEILY